MAKDITADQPNQSRNTRKRCKIFNLEDQLLFYAQYHHNTVNIAIHMIFVPLIFFTSLILAHNTSYFSKTDLRPITGPLEIPERLIQTGLFGLRGTTYDLNLATLTSILYTSYFIILEPIAGLLYSPILLLLGHWSNVIVSEDYYSKDYFKITLIIWSLAWIFQFIGHGKFEKRKPALLDNLFQSFVLAVFFVWLELLFLLGYRPELKRSLDQKVELAIFAHRRAALTNHHSHPTITNDSTQSEKS